MKNILEKIIDEKKQFLKQIKKGKYKKEVLYGNGSAAKRIIGVLKNSPSFLWYLSIRKLLAIHPYQKRRSLSSEWTTTWTRQVS